MPPVIARAVDRYTPFTPVELTALKQAGIDAICAYIGRHTRGLQNGISPLQLKSYVDHGFKVVFNFEAASNHRSYFNAAEGTRDGLDVVKEMAWLGVKPDPSIIVYNSVDYDAYTQADFDAADAYESAFLSALQGEFSEGEYAGVLMLKHSDGTKHAPKGDWQAAGWANGEVLPNAKIIQVSVDTWIAGMQVDVDEIYADPGWYPRPLTQANPSEGVKKMSTFNVLVGPNKDSYTAVFVGGKSYVHYTASLDLGATVQNKAHDGTLLINGKSVTCEVVNGSDYVPWDQLSPGNKIDVQRVAQPDGSTIDWFTVAQSNTPVVPNAPNTVFQVALDPESYTVVAGQKFHVTVNTSPALTTDHLTVTDTSGDVLAIATSSPVTLAVNAPTSGTEFALSWVIKDSVGNTVQQGAGPSIALTPAPTPIVGQEAFGTEYAPKTLDEANQDAQHVAEYGDQTQDIPVGTPVTAVGGYYTDPSKITYYVVVGDLEMWLKNQAAFTKTVVGDSYLRSQSGQAPMKATSAQVQAYDTTAAYTEPGNTSCPFGYTLGANGVCYLDVTKDYKADGTGGNMPSAPVSYSPGKALEEFKAGNLPGPGFTVGGVWYGTVGEAVAASKATGQPWQGN